MVPRREGGKGGSGGEVLRTFLRPHPFFPKKTPFLSTEIGPLYTKSFVNERAKMKERRQNYRKIRVQDDSITETTNAKSPLRFQNML